MLRRAAAAILMLLTLTGCWSRVELNDLGVAIGMGVDTGQNSAVRLTLYIARGMTGGAGASKSPGDPDWVVSREGQNIADAMREIALTAPRRITLHHLRVVVMGEEYARRGAGEVLDFVARHPQIRLTSRPLVAQGRAEALLQTPPHLETLQADALAELILAKGGIDQRFKDVLVGRVSKTRSTWTHALSVVQQGGETPRAVQLAGVAVFRDDKMVTFLEPRAAQAIFWMLQNPRESVISSQCPGDDPDKTFSVEVDRGNITPIPQMTSGQVSLQIMTDARVNVLRSDCPLSLVDPASRQQMERELEADLTERLDDATGRLQQVGADPLGFGRRVQRVFPAYFRRIEEQWPDVWARMPVRYAVRVEIRHPGLLIDPINRTRGTVPMETP